jgi:dTDP-L-rhamnose 4-epimerase
MVGLGVDFADAPAYVSHNDTGTAVLLGVLHDRDFAGRLVVASSMVVYGEGVSRCPEHGTVRPATRTKRELDAGRYEPTCPLCGASCRPEPVTESAPLDPRNVYAATKLHQEHLCAAFGREHDATVVALRYHNVYGPRMPRDTPYAGVASIFRSAAERGEAPQVLEDGRQRRDFIEVSDVARANVAALTIDEGGSGADNSYSTYNVCSGEPHTVLDMADALIASIPGAAPAKVVGGYRLGDVRHVFASPEKARAELGFRARVGFREGMARFAAADLRT